MKEFALTTAAGAALIAAALGSAGAASAAVVGPVNAATAIQELRANGYRIILNKVGAESLSQCTVTSIHVGRSITETVPAGGGDTTQKVVYTPVYVDVGC